MAYAPNEAGSLVPGTTGKSEAWDAVVSNDAELYATHPSGYAMTARDLSVDGSTLTEVARFCIPANYDDMAVTLHFLYNVEAASTGVVSLSVTDGSSTDTNSVTGLTSAGYTTLTVTLSSSAASSTPRYAVLSINATAGKTITLNAFTSYMSPLQRRAAN